GGSTTNNGGSTTSSNLFPLCRRHHRAKTHRNWQYRPDPHEQAIIWTSPAGYVYRVDRYATTRVHAPGLPPPSGPHDRSSRGDDLDDPALYGGLEYYSLTRDAELVAEATAARARA
ncbi:MAG: hypothetical protein CSA58_06290, partial [Micrococcales bacterium]